MDPSCNNCAIIMESWVKNMKKVFSTFSGTVIIIIIFINGQLLHIVSVYTSHSPHIWQQLACEFWINFRQKLKFLSDFFIVNIDFNYTINSNSTFNKHCWIITEKCVSAIVNCLTDTDLVDIFFYKSPQGAFQCWYSIWVLLQINMLQQCCPE